MDCLTGNAQAVSGRDRIRYSFRSATGAPSLSLAIDKVRDAPLPAASVDYVGYLERPVVIVALRGVQRLVQWPYCGAGCHCQKPLGIECGEHGREVVVVLACQPGHEIETVA